MIKHFHDKKIPQVPVKRPTEVYIPYAKIKQFCPQGTSCCHSSPFSANCGSPITGPTLGRTCCYGFFPSSGFKQPGKEPRTKTGKKPGKAGQGQQTPPSWQLRRTRMASKCPWRFPSLLPDPLGPIMQLNLMKGPISCSPRQDLKSFTISSFR